MKNRPTAIPLSSHHFNSRLEGRIILLLYFCIILPSCALWLIFAGVRTCSRKILYWAITCTSSKRTQCSNAGILVLNWNILPVMRVRSWWKMNPGVSIPLSASTPLVYDCNCNAELSCAVSVYHTRTSDEMNSVKWILVSEIGRASCRERV